RGGIERGNIGDDRRRQKQRQLGTAEYYSVDFFFIAQTSDQRDDIPACVVPEIALQHLPDVPLVQPGAIGFLGGDDLDTITRERLRIKSAFHRESRAE